MNSARVQDSFLRLVRLQFNIPLLVLHARIWLSLRSTVSKIAILDYRLQNNFIIPYKIRCRMMRFLTRPAL